MSRIAAAQTADGVIGVLIEAVVLLSRTQSENGNERVLWAAFLKGEICRWCRIAFLTTMASENHN